MASSAAAEPSAAAAESSARKIELKISDGEEFVVEAVEPSAAEPSAAAAAAESSARKITLMSSDGEEFVIDEAVALESQTLKNLIDDDCADSAIPLPNVTAKVLAKVLEWCVRHVEAALEGDADLGEKAAARLKEWDADYVKVDQTTLFELILAANYLNIKGLLDVTCQKVADDIKDKSPEDIRTIFNIENDYTKEEEEEVRKENAWAFE